MVWVPPTVPELFLFLRFVIQLLVVITTSLPLLYRFIYLINQVKRFRLWSLFPFFLTALLPFVWLSHHTADKCASDWKPAHFPWILLMLLEPKLCWRFYFFQTWHVCQWLGQICKKIEDILIFFFFKSNMIKCLKIVKRAPSFIVWVWI